MSDRNEKKVFIVYVVLLTVYCLLSFLGCKKKETKVAGEKVINVQVQPAEKKSLKPFIETIGTLNPDEEVTISAEVDGILKDVRVDEGSVVSKGQVLAFIDDIDYNLEVKRADAALRQAEATLSNTRLEYQRKEALDHRALVIITATGIFIFSLFITRFIGKEFVPPEDQSRFMVRLKSPIDYSVDEVDRNLKDTRHSSR